jgi:hypothetical protein
LTQVHQLSGNCAMRNSNLIAADTVTRGEDLLGQSCPRVRRVGLGAAPFANRDSRHRRKRFSTIGSIFVDHDGNQRGRATSDLNAGSAQPYDGDCIAAGLIGGGVLSRFPGFPGF